MNAVPLVQPKKLVISDLPVPDLRTNDEEV